MSEIIMTETQEEKIHIFQDMRDMILEDLQARISRVKNHLPRHTSQCKMCDPEQEIYCPSGVVIRDNQKRVLKELNKMIKEADHGFDYLIRGVLEGNI
jgi:hypothetical protein